MKKMMLVLFCLLLSATFANATLLTNGDFENPNLSGGWQVYSSIPAGTPSRVPVLRFKRVELWSMPNRGINMLNSTATEIV